MNQLLHLCPPPDKTATGKPDGLSYLQNWREFHSRETPALRFARTWAMVSNNTPAIIHGIDTEDGIDFSKGLGGNIFSRFKRRRNQKPQGPPILMCLRLTENERNGHVVAVVQDRKGFIYIFDPNFGLSDGIWDDTKKFICYIKATYENSSNAFVSSCSILNLINMNDSGEINLFLQEILNDQLSNAAIQRIGLGDYLYDEALEKKEEIFRAHNELLLRLQTQKMTKIGTLDNIKGV